MQQLDGNGLVPSNGARPTTSCWKAIRKPARNTQMPNSTASTPETPPSRENIRERQTAGIAAAKEQGVYPGRQRGTTKAKRLRTAELRASNSGCTVSVSRSTTGSGTTLGSTYTAGSYAIGCLSCFGAASHGQESGFQCDVTDVRVIHRVDQHPQAWRLLSSRFHDAESSPASPCLCVPPRPLWGA